MAARNVAECKGHRQHGEAESERDAGKTDPQSGETRGEDRAAAAPSTSQNVPMTSAVSFFDKGMGFPRCCAAGSPPVVCLL
jgi:hypothetical protein